MDFEQIKKKARARERIVQVCLAGDMAGEVERLEAELSRVTDGWRASSLADKKPGQDIAKKIEAARARMRDSEVPFRLRALGDRAWSDLVAAHPPENPETEAWNPTTFPPALLAACCADPVMTPEQVDELAQLLNQGQLAELYNAAIEVNSEPTQVPFSLAASAILSGTAGK